MMTVWVTLVYLISEAWVSDRESDGDRDGDDEEDRDLDNEDESEDAELGEHSYIFQHSIT